MFEVANDPRKDDKIHNIDWLQDGATPHYDDSVREWKNPEQWIGRKWPIE